MNTTYGILDVKSRARISINQSNVNAKELKRVEIPLLCDRLQKIITLCFDDSFNLIQASEVKYAQAQTLLLSELGLNSWQPKHRLTFIKNYSDLEQSERIDAEYFHPKYEELAQVIKSYLGGWGILSNLVKINEQDYHPRDNREYKYVELSNIANNGEITGCMIAKGQDLPSRARRKVLNGEVIVSSIQGSLDSIALVGKEYDKSLCSTGFHVIKSKVFNSETLLVLMKSIVGQFQLNKRCSGTILAAINKIEFNQIILPIIADEKQNQIQQIVSESFDLRRKSKHLLECATRAVEIAIEQDERSAINWLEGHYLSC